MMVEILMMRRMSCCDCCGNLRKVLYWNYAENKLLALTWCEAIDCSILAAAVTESWIRPRSHLSKITSILHLQYRVPGTLEESIFWEGTVCIALGTTRHKIYIFFMVFTGSAQKGLRIELVQPKNYQVHWFHPILTYSNEKIIQIERVPTPEHLVENIIASYAVPETLTFPSKKCFSSSSENENTSL